MSICEVKNFNGRNQWEKEKQEGYDGPGVAHLSFPDCVV